MKIPFNWTPTSWALRGNMRKRAEIEYTLTGFDRDGALLALDYPEAGDEYDQKVNKLLYKYEKISEETYDFKAAEFIVNDHDRELTLLELKHKYDRIGENEYAKAIATLKDEPWIYVPEVTIDPESAEYGGFHFDWNDAFIKWLQSQGYDAPSDELIVEAWFNDVCKHVALEQFDGLGDFNDKLNDLDDEENFGRIDDERFFKK